MVYAVTGNWPRQEQLRLVDQCRRAAVSIPSHLANGRSRFGSRVLLLHISIGHGSFCELETHPVLGQALSYGAERSLQTRV
jgi:four helix bundle protein